MKLVTFGCSWIYGDELNPNTTEYRNSNNLGGLIYNNHSDLFSDYINYSGNGSSNERIAIQLFEYVNSEHYSKDDFLLIGLSSPARRLDFINRHKLPFTKPHWDEMHIKEYKKIDKHFVEWFKLETIYNLNNRNETKRYFFNLNTISNIIKNNKFLVFQSIDNISNIYDNIENDGWFELPIHFYSSKENSEFEIPSKIVFSKDYLEKFLNKGLNENQNWINFDFTWDDYLKSFQDDSKYYCNGISLHPSEWGVKQWYEYIKKYIEELK